MTATLLLGLGLSGGLLLILTGLFPARIPLSDALGRVHLPRTNVSVRSSERLSLLNRLFGAPVAATFVGRALDRRTSIDLRIVGTTSSELLAKMTLTFLVGVVWAPAVAGVMALGGVGVGWVLPAWGSLLLGSVGAAVPMLALRVDAAKRRRAFLHALSCFLDLVAVRLASGAGVDGALNQCAEAGRGWAFVEIRQALAEARLMGEAPWGGLARLGEDLGIAELGELAASVSLAGNEGARVRTSLSAKARSIRTKGLAEAQASAESASERMSLPVVMLMFGFVTFLGYPAVTQVLTGL